MQKAALLLVPLGALAALVLVFVLMKKREPEGGMGGPVGILKRGGSTDSAAAESARLRSENEALRKEVEAARKRAEAAEMKLAEASAEAASPEKAADAKKAAAKKGGDWKKRRDAELEAKVKSMDWRKNTKGLMDYWKELEKARVEGRAPRMDPDMAEALTQLQKDAAELYEFLGKEGKNMWDAFNNELVQEAWMDAFLHELTGGSVTEDQLSRLRSTALYRTEEPNFQDGSLLEAWKWLIEHNKSYTSDTAGVLTPEQLSKVAQSVPPTFMLSVYAQYAERNLSGAGAVTDYWLDSFKVPADQRAAVESVAGEFTKQLAELTQAYTSQYGSTLPRDADFELRLKALELQIAAENKLAQTLQLDAEQLKKLTKGSGAVIKLVN